MLLDLRNKTVLVTGSSNGIGFSIAQCFLEYGCFVIINGRTNTALENATHALNNENVHAIVADVSIPNQAVKLVSESAKLRGGIDILVCNVGSGISVLPGEENLSEWNRVFAQNLWSTTNMVEASLELLAKSKGSIICISSICGNEVIAGAPLTYSCAKSALNAYVRGVSRPLSKRGIRINAVAPGNILFEGSTWSRKLKEDPQLVGETIKREVALETFGTPEDIANMVTWLASSKSRFVTGAVFTIDGGQVRS
jgi:3-oxoacyl-[acyl-carrier protein] reductase